VFLAINNERCKEVRICFKPLQASSVTFENFRTGAGQNTKAV